jgi:hypothetical protein
MSFFTKGKPAADNAALPASAPAAVQPPPAAQQPAAKAPERVPLDQQTEDILKKAGEDARKALLKEKDEIDAAE